LKVQTANPVAKPTKRYDLEERTLGFARLIIQFVNALPRTVANTESGKQLVRSAGSIGANYIEANEALGRKDFVMRARIARKETKETLLVGIGRVLRNSSSDSKRIGSRGDRVIEDSQCNYLQSRTATWTCLGFDYLNLCSCFGSCHL
jgi:four helix bundle protein